MTHKISIVSACLAGISCRYDCASATRLDIVEMVRAGEAIPLCPEQLAGLPTPRPPAEQQEDGSIKDIHGKDISTQFNHGALEALKIVQLSAASHVYLKSKSPMCGVDKIYDGHFTGKLIAGDGIFTALLKKLKIKITVID